MINYSNLNVKDMTENQMEALKGLKFVESSTAGEGIDSGVNNNYFFI